MRYHNLIKTLSDIGYSETGYTVANIQAGKLVVSRSRMFMHVVLKACVINILYRHHGVSCIEIARNINMHHSTVIHHLRAHQLRNECEDVYHDVYKVMAVESQKDSQFMMNIESALNTIKNL